MPMSGAVLGAALDISANASNPPAAALTAAIWLAQGTAWISHIQAFAVVKPGSLVATSAGAISPGGAGTIGGMNAATLSVQLAAATLCPPSVGTWQAIAQAFIDYVTKNATVAPGTLAGPPGTPTPGGPCTGGGIVSGLSASDLGPLLCKAAGTDKSAAAQSTWLNMATNLIAQLTASLAGTGLTCPSGGGPLVGTGTIS